jgi:hypothetical protein
MNKTDEEEKGFEFKSKYAFFNNINMKRRILGRS